MSSDLSTSASTSTGLGGTVFIVFLILKLTGTIAWSWWWVTAPLWIPIAFLFLAVFLGVLIVLVFQIAEVLGF